MRHTDKKRTTVIAVCGKGGVGKTSISATLVRILSANSQNKVLAIDADPAVGLATALGIKVGKTVDDIRSDFIQQLESGNGADKTDILTNLDYELFSALEEKQNLAFLAIGRPEKKGCYCKVNGILKDVIASIVDNFDYVVIDGEAGIEQVNRRVMEKVSHLLLVSDASAKGLNVVKTISQVASAAVNHERSGLILNRIRGREELELISISPELNFLGWIPEDDTIRVCDIKGESILGLDDCPAIQATKECMISMGLPV
ncbi:AAA family ATPase [bacterium]|nr:AAA family ATPase [bacterium]